MSSDFNSWMAGFVDRFARELSQRLGAEMGRSAGPAAAGWPDASTGPAAKQAAYGVLGLDPGAATEEVRRRYRLLARRLHPDVAGPETEGLFRMLTWAYETLTKG